MKPTRKALHTAKLATVTLPSTQGRGVLVPGGFILTATHCVEWDGSAGLVLGDHHPVSVKTAGGQTFRVRPCFADAVSDLAVLGELDNQVFPDDCDAFEEWHAATTPVTLSPWAPRPRRLSRLAPRAQTGVGIDVLTLSLDGRWTPGRAVRYGLGPTPGVIALEATEPIRGGMSGGPIVDRAGRLVGVVSNGSDTGTMPLARMILPTWLLLRMVAS